MKFDKILLNWYGTNRRDLPWRRNRDPYAIWISEIILQQTRIEQGTAYYHRFLERFPDVKTLAGADEEEVLKLWQGLGYYSRARNLHAAAKQILQRHRGAFPSSYDDIRKLKGIGDYTAAAISSIAFGLPYPVVDGNVLRFLARYFAIKDPVDMPKGKKAVLKKAAEFIDKKDPGGFNQALMEFGALQCRPGIPGCKTCPLKKSCAAFRSGSVAGLPVKSKKQPQRTRHFHYLVIAERSQKGSFLYIRKRTGSDIWKNLFDFPLIETKKAVSLEKLARSDEWKEITGSSFKVISGSKVYRHILSHQVILAKFYLLEIPSGLTLPFIKVSLNELKKYPIPRLIELFLETTSP